MDKNQAKLAVQKLVEKYEEVLKSGKSKSYTEEDTKNGFIVPLFTALGWDMEDRNEVTAEEHISGDRVDYGVYVNNRVKFYLEAKPLKADLLREDYANQAVRYSWNKGVKGHFHHSKEWKEEISKRYKGIKRPIEVGRKVSQTKQYNSIQRKQVILYKTLFPQNYGELLNIVNY